MRIALVATLTFLVIERCWSLGHPSLRRALLKSEAPVVVVEDGVPFSLDLMPGEKAHLEYTYAGEGLATTTCTSRAPDGYKGDVDLRDERFEDDTNFVACKSTVVDHSNETCSLLSEPGQTLHMGVEHFKTSLANSTDDLIFECTSESVEEIALGAPVSVSLVPGQAIYYTLPEKEEGTTYYCEARVGANATTEADVDLVMMQLDATIPACSATKAGPGNGESCSLTPNGTALVAIRSSLGSGSLVEDATLTCNAGMIQEIEQIDADGAIMLPVPLEPGMLHKFVYTNPIMFQHVQCIVISPASLGDESVASQIRFNMGFGNATNATMLDMRTCSANANEFCHLSVMNEDTPMMMTIVTDVMVDDAMLECTATTKNPTDNDLLENGVATTTSLGMGEAMYFGYSHSDDIPSNIACTALVNGTMGTSPSDQVALSVIPEDMQTYTMFHSYANPEAKVELSWGTSQMFYVLLESYETMDQEVQISCTSEPYTSVPLNEPMEFSPTKHQYEYLTPDLEGMEFPLEVNCTLWHSEETGRNIVGLEIFKNGLVQMGTPVRGELRTDATSVSQVIAEPAQVGFIVFPLAPNPGDMYMVSCEATSMQEEGQNEDDIPLEVTRSFNPDWDGGVRE